MSFVSYRTLRNAAILACICGAYLFNVQRWHPEIFFGRFHDDSLYFSSAKALSQGQGYVIASFPGTPPQTKYPIVLPWLLSWIWKWNPAFPENLKPATWVIESFGIWALIASFLLLKKLPGVGEKPALFLTGLLAFQPIFLRMSGLLMADVPFMALMLTALLLADRAMISRRTGVFGCADGINCGTWNGDAFRGGRRRRGIFPAGGVATRISSSAAVSAPRQESCSWASRCRCCCNTRRQRPRLEEAVQGGSSYTPTTRATERSGGCLCPRCERCSF